MRRHAAFLIIITHLYMFLFNFSASASQSAISDSQALHLLQSAGGVAVKGDDLWFESSDILYMWESNRTVTRIDTQYPGGVLLSDGEDIYCWDPSSGELFLLKDHQFAFCICFDTDGAFGSGVENPSLIQAELTSKHLCLLLTNPLDAGLQIWVYDRHTGKRVVTYQGDILSMAAFRDDEILIAEGKREICINSMSLSSAKVNFLMNIGELRPDSMVYELKKQTLYISADTQLYAARQGKEPQAIGRENAGEGVRGRAQIYDNRYIKSSIEEDRTYINSPFECENEKITLTVGGGFWGEREQNPRFRELHPDVILSFEKAEINRDIYLTRIMTKESKADVYIMNTNDEIYRALIEKGYMYPLSGSETLMREAQRMYSNLAAPLWGDDGLLYAFAHSGPNAPVLQGCYADHWNETGLGDIPVTLDELLDACKTLAGLEGDWLLWRFGDAQSYKQDMLTLIIDTYVSHCIRSGEEADMNTALFRRLIERFDQLKPSLELLGKRCEEMQNENGRDGDKLIPYTLLENMYSLLPEHDDYHGQRMMPIPLSIEADLDALIPAFFPVLMISSNSPYKELAMEYIECFMLDFSMDTQVMLYPDQVQPVLHEAYERESAELNAKINSLTDQLKQAEPYQRQEIEQGIDMYTQHVEDLEENRHWFIPPQSVGQYLSLQSLIYMDEYRALTHRSGGDSQMLRLLNQFIDGAIDADAFADRYDQMLRLIQGENK